MVGDGFTSLLLKGCSLEDQSEISLRILEGGRWQQRCEGRDRCFCERRGWAWKGARPAPLFHIGKRLSTFPWKPVSVNTGSSFVWQAWHPFLWYLYGITSQQYDANICLPGTRHTVFQSKACASSIWATCNGTEHLPSIYIHVSSTFKLVKWEAEVSQSELHTSDLWSEVS